MDENYTLAVGITQFVGMSIVLSSGYFTPRVVEYFGIAPALGLGAVMASLSIFFVL